MTWGLFTSTPGLLNEARNNIEKLIAFWPLLILLLTYAFQRFFKGNVVAAASTVYIEVVRGVPLITVLFMAIIMAPLFFPAGFQVKNAWAVLIAFSLFTAAYLAENVRGGLQSIPKGQYEAADAIGLNTLQKMRFIILPQALRAVIPAIVGLFIGVFKDSSLVAVVGLFDMLGITNAIIGNPQWLGLRTELYLFASIIYFIGSFAMSSYSRRLETRLGVGVR
jgi:general L-amino acid transport system permease protein